MIFKGRAVFVGVDGSMGFQHGRGYSIKIKRILLSYLGINKYGRYMLTTDHKRPVSRWSIYNGRLFCPYSSMDAIYENWELDQ